MLKKKLAGLVRCGQKARDGFKTGFDRLTGAEATARVDVMVREAEEVDAAIVTELIELRGKVEALEARLAAPSPPPGPADAPSGAGRIGRRLVPWLPALVAAALVAVDLVARLAR